MIDLYSLPATLPIGGRDFAINSDFHTALDIFRLMNEPDISPYEMMEIALAMFYPDYDSIPPGMHEEAYMAMAEFLGCGIQDDGAKEHPRLIDWDKDANLIIAAVNRTAHIDVRTVEDLHWWTFFSYFMEIRESTLSDYINIRYKLAKHKKLEKYEQEFYRANKDAISLSGASETAREQMQSILNFLDGAGEK